MKNEQKTKKQLIDELTELRHRISELQSLETEHEQTGQLLKEPENIFKSVFENAGVAIFIADADTGAILDCNIQAEKLIGRRRGDIIGTYQSKLHPKGEEEKYRNRFSRHAEKGHAADYQGEAQHMDGSRTPVFISAQPMKLSGKNMVVGIFTDISELKRAEQELTKTKEQLESFIENSLDPIVITDHKGLLTGTNKAFLKMIGHSEEEVLGKPSYKFSITKEGTYESTTGELVTIGEDFFRESSEKIAQFFKEGKIANWMLYYINKENKIIPVNQNAVFLYNDKGEKTATFGIARDITEQLKAEKKIREARDFLESVIEGSSDGIAIVDQNGYMTSANTALEKMTKFKKEELIGSHASVLTIEAKDRKKAFLEKMGELLEKGFVSYETKHKTKDGNIIDVECNSSMIKDDKGNYFAGISIIRDITDRKKIEQKLLQAEKLKSLGELAGGVAHDFNNVLAAIMGNAQLLKMDIEAPLGIQERRQSIQDLNKGLDIIVKAAKDGAETVRRIQEFARRKADDKYFVAVNINEVIDHALDFTQVRWKDDCEAKGIKIDIQKEFSPLPLTAGSASELREVFINLIHNAIDAMPKGGQIKIKTFKDGNSITVKLEDTGMGIHKALLNRVLDPFFTTKGVQSTGLGLSVSHGIINRHRGTIAIDSIEGQGATITITLPISEKILGEEEKLIPLSVEPKKARILVIEDKEQVRNLLYSCLLKGGHEVEAVSDGAQGIETFEKGEFDLVFTDLGMPGMSGWQVAEKIKSINGRVPVVLITGWDIKLKESEIRESYIDLIIQKPFDVDQILRLVQEGMALRERFKSV